LRTSYGNKAGKRAFLVNVAAFDSSLWCPETETNILVEPSTFAHALALSGLCFSVEEDMWLLLESAFALHL
jgi:hypothetical protein